MCSTDESPKLGIVIGTQSFDFAQRMNEQRVTRHNRHSALGTKEARKVRKEELQAAANQMYAEKEGLLCGAGIAD